MRGFYMLPVAALCMAFAADDASLLPDGPGKETVVKVCTGCHGTANFRKARLSRDDWQDKVADMVDRGAKATDEQLAAVVDYLTQNFGPDSKIWVNTAPVGELRAVLKLSADEAGAVVRYREEKGNFREWRDLLKVPGVDAGKIEAKKVSMAF